MSDIKEDWKQKYEALAAENEKLKRQIKLETSDNEEEEDDDEEDEQTPTSELYNYSNTKNHLHLVGIHKLIKTNITTLESTYREEVYASFARKIIFLTKEILEGKAITSQAIRLIESVKKKMDLFERETDSSRREKLHTEIVREAEELQRLVEAEKTKYIEAPRLIPSG